MKNEITPTQSAWMRDVAHTHGASLLRYAQSITHDPQRAQDAVQETFVRLCQVQRAEVESHLAPWLFKVCRSRAIDLARKEGRLMTGFDSQSAEREPDAAPTPSASLETADLSHRVLSMLGDLPPNQREVVRLKFQNGLSYKEIADVTSLTVTNVGFLLHTALRTLRTRLIALDAPPTA